MMKKYTLTKYISLALITISLISCDEEYAKEIDIEVLVASDMKDAKKRITKDIQDLFWFIESEKCKDTVFIPRVTISRLDLDKERTDSLTIPLSTINSFKKSMGTLRPVHILTDYNEEVPNLKLPDFLFVPSEKTINQEDVIEKYTIDYRYALDSLKIQGEGFFYSPKSIRQDIATTICDFKKSTFTILYGYDSDIPGSTTDEYRTDIDPITVDPCSASTLSKAVDLKEAMLEIIDTSKSDSQRLKIADKVWDTYFSKNAYVNRYSDTTGSTALGYYEPGQGKAYFTNRISIIESITDINIFRIEFSTRKGEEHKISGIFLAECHNASEMVQEEWN